MNFLPLPSAVRLREILDYCPETGGFTWRKTHSNAAMAGTKAGSPNSKGYISIKIGGTQYKAHRLAWLYVYGEDPGHHEIDHADYATHSENELDKRRHGSVLCGEKHLDAKLNDAIVRDLRADLQGKTQSWWARRLGVSEAALSRAISGATWRHLISQQ